MSRVVLDLFLWWLLPCGHKNQSRPMRLPGEVGAYRTCLECGRRQRYHLFDLENRVPPAFLATSHSPDAAFPMARRHPAVVQKLESPHTRPGSQVA